MIGTLAYLAALSEPDIASAASEASAKLVEATGKRLAAGMLDEVAGRLNAASGPLLGSTMCVIAGGTSAASIDLEEDIARRCEAVF